MLDLNFNQCLVLLVLLFIFMLIIARCFMAVVNRGFLLVDYANKKLFGKNKNKGGGGMIKELMGGLVQEFMPEIKEAAKGFLGMKKVDKE